MRLERLRLKNFKMFREVLLEDIPPLAVFVGVNGSGKTTLFDAFDFVRDSLHPKTMDVGIDAALTAQSSMSLGKRGGFRAVRTRGEDEPIEIEMTFRADLGGAARPISYLLRIGEDGEQKACIEREVLSFPLGDNGCVNVLDFARGKGTIVLNEADVLKGEKAKTRDTTVRPMSVPLPAVVGFGRVGDYESASVEMLRKFVENWHLSNFQNPFARQPVDAGKHDHLAEYGQNLAGFVHFMQDRPEFQATMEKMAQRVPGFSDARAKLTANGEFRLMFNDTHWEKPFDAGTMSDGTLKMLGILSLLHDPEPRSLLCVEEPEKEMYPHLLGELVGDFRSYANRSGGHVLVSTHSYELLNSAKPEEVFWLDKRDGITKIRRARDNDMIVRMVRDGGDVMGRLWRMGELTDPVPAP